MKESWNNRHQKWFRYLDFQVPSTLSNCHISENDANQSSRDEPRFTINVFYTRLNLTYLLPGFLKVTDTGGGGGSTCLHKAVAFL